MNPRKKHFCILLGMNRPPTWKSKLKLEYRNTCVSIETWILSTAYAFYCGHSGCLKLDAVLESVPLHRTAFEMFSDSG